MEKRINELLKKYYDGETSVEEESLLFDFFDQNQPDESFSIEKDQFMFFREERKKNLPKRFEDKLEELILEQEKTPATPFSYFQNWFSIAALFLIVIGLSWWLFNTDSVDWKEQMASDKIPTEVTLADGSIIFLNKKSQIRYPEKFKGKREIYFQGEGFFEIAPDPDKPFFIHMENSQVEVLGTSFNIRNYEEEPNVV